MRSVFAVVYVGVCLVISTKRKSQHCCLFMNAIQGKRDRRRQTAVHTDPFLFLRPFFLSWPRLSNGVDRGYDSTMHEQETLHRRSSEY